MIVIICHAREHTLRAPLLAEFRRGAPSFAGKTEGVLYGRGRGTIARQREVGWLSGVAGVKNILLNRLRCEDRFGHDQNTSILDSKDHINIPSINIAWYMTHIHTNAPYIGTVQYDGTSQGGRSSQLMLPISRTPVQLHKYAVAYSLPIIRRCKCRRQQL